MSYGNVPARGPGYGHTRRMAQPVPERGAPPRSATPPRPAPPGSDGPYGPPADGRFDPNRRGGSPAGPPDGPTPGGYGAPPPRPRPKKRRVGRVFLIIGLVFVLLLGGMWIYLDTSLNRVNALGDYPGRPAPGAGTNWLIVGSDSRAGLSKEERRKLRTGGTSGRRTDTIMVAHIPDNDTKPTLMSIPRDLEVNIPNHGPGKINAAFAYGGPRLLARVVETKTGLRMDHYAEISFGGLAGIVDAIGGVEMTIKQDIHDTATGITIKKGTQTLDGVHALAFVRTRKSAATPRSDLDRVVNQRQFIGALAGEMGSLGTLLNPFDLFPMLGAIPDALTVNEGDHLHHLIGLGWAMRGISDGGMVTTTAPVTDGSATALHPAKSKALFDALRNDTPVPKSAIYK